MSLHPAEQQAQRPNDGPPNLGDGGDAGDNREGQVSAEMSDDASTPPAARTWKDSLFIRILKDPDIITAAMPGQLPEMIRLANRARIGSLAAECAFWCIFILPWTLLGAVASISWWQRFAGVNAVLDFQERLLKTLEHVLTPAGVTQYAKPVLDDVLLVDHRGLTLVGLLVALWSGSRLVSSLVAGTRIVHTLSFVRPVQARSWLHIRAVSLGTYTAGLVFGGFVMPLLLAVPALSRRWGFSGAGKFGMWAALVGLITVLLVALYLTAIPRKPERSMFYGAIVTLVIGWAGTMGLQTYFSNVAQVDVFSAFAVPIAFLMWVYVLCFGVMLGAVVDTVLSKRR